jgi:ribonuclease BN (tRNA processing enzyme)
VELVVLGTCAAWPEPRRAATGVLVRLDGVSVALDLGPGTLPRLLEVIPHERLDAVIVTHKHLDHCLDLYPLSVARVFHPERLPRIPLYAPPGVFERIAALEDAEGVEELRNEIFDVRAFEPGESFEVGPFRVDTRLLPHMVPNAGLRVQGGGASLAYTGDTGPSDQIVELARGVDLLVSEASWHEVDDRVGPIHLTARQAGEHAARSEASRLMLTHFWPGLDRDVSREQASEAFGGDLLLADEGLRVEVG